MLKPEQAEKLLQQWKHPDNVDAEERILSVISKIPKPLKGLAYGLKGRDPNGNDFKDWDAREKGTAHLGKEIDALTAKDRTKLFATFLPNVAGEMEVTWQFLKATPYQIGYSRKAFRAPKNPEATAESRKEWLDSLITCCEDFLEDAITTPWLAAWTPHAFRWQGDTMGRLLAGVIDKGGKPGEEVFEILRQSLTNEHEVGAMGDHVVRAFLLSSRQDGWELIEKTLIAAQRQEGLRQSILEAVDESHPEAFRRILALIRDKDLTRFSATVRAANVWFGMMWDSVSSKVINESINQALKFLDDPAARTKALNGTDAPSVFRALWAVAYEDAMASIPLAVKLLKHKQEDIRFVAVQHLGLLGLKQANAAKGVALEDESLQVALCAMSTTAGINISEAMEDVFSEDDDATGDDLFERLENLFARVPEKPVKLKPIVWPWTERKANREEVAESLESALGDRPPTRLIPYLPAFNTWRRASVVESLSKQKKWDKLTRETLFDLAGDAGADVREAAFKALDQQTLQPGEAEKIEGYLTRKAADLRRGVVQLLFNQPDAKALSSADRLVASKDGNQRLAGLELLRQLAEADRGRSTCKTRGEVYATARKKLTKEEQTQLDAIRASDRERLSFDNCLGLLNPAGRSPVVAPQKKNVEFITPAAVACLKSLDEFIHKHRETPVTYKRYDGMKTEMLGSIGWGFPSPDTDKSPEKQAERLPLRELWMKWLDERPKTMIDKDGLELLRARIWWKFADSYWFSDFKKWMNKSPENKKLGKAIVGEYPAPKLKYENVVEEILDWLLFLKPPAKVNDFLLDVVETSYALVPPKWNEGLVKLAEKASAAKQKGEDFDDDDIADEHEKQDWRNLQVFEIWEEGFPYGKATVPQQVRHWKLLHWRDEPVPGALRDRAYLKQLAVAYEHKAATYDDLVDQVMSEGSNSWSRFGDLNALTSRKPEQWMQKLITARPEVKELADRARAKLLDIELARGEAPTVSSKAALAVDAYWGIDTLLRILAAIGKPGFKLVHGYRGDDGKSRQPTLTSLARQTYPKPDDTVDEFAKRMKIALADGTMTEERLLQLAFLAPQWTKFIEGTLKWEGFGEGLYWFLAHMRYSEGSDEAAEGEGFEDDDDDDEDDDDDDDEDDDESDDDDSEREKLSPWDRLILERTPLTGSERYEGAIDVEWFRRTHQQLGGKRWEAIAAAAKFAANSAQAKRAQFLAETLLGKTNRKELIAGVKTKKLKDYVRLLGLLPLATGAGRDADLLERYHVLTEYRRYAKTLSSLTKPQALRACEIGMQNLARTANYADPLRLEWAMEGDSVKDLSGGPISVSKDGVTVTLALDERSFPQMTIVRGDKPLKSIPPAIKKDKKVAALAERVTDLKRQASRVKQSLETAMCRGDAFSAAELIDLCQHAILAPQLTRLVLVGDGILGYPDKGGKVLRNHAGKMEAIKKGEQLRIAHPYDLFAAGDWDKWQHECFQAERLQPFKQVFRELYVVTKQEKSDGASSKRYAGQQVNPKQANALWNSRGWNTQDDVFKTFHEAGITVEVSFNYGFTTPLEVEGLTLDTIEFRARDDAKLIPLTKVPPRIFSETMRDIDLVVSVAHRGGVDPEASASTVEMRSTLVRETCQLLGLKNVRLKAQHALIDGHLANYSLHLGSGTIHRMPGGHLCVMPVHSQHRGRLFLPFADDDPRTAEVISKVLLLARDKEIQDPSILDQLRG